MDLRRLVPAELLVGTPRATTRHLYLFRKPGYLTCVFQRHPRPQPEVVSVRSYPAGSERTVAMWRTVSREMLAVSYLLEGEGRVRYVKERQTFDLSAGWIFQYNLHTGGDVQLELEPGSLECSACVDGDTGRHLAAVELWNGERMAEHIGLHASLVEQYVTLFHELPEPGLSSGSLMRRFLTLVEHVNTRADAADPNRTFRGEARALLSAHPEPSYRMQDAAKVMGLSYETFRQRFLKTVGISPTEYQLRRRMERACELLEHSSVQKTAAALGYSDPFAFSRQFRQRIGVAPSMYRRTRG